jgi:protein Mpv17
MGPFIGKWLRLIEKHIPMVKAASGGGGSSTGIQLAKRVLADQVVMYVTASVVYTRHLHGYS